MTWFHTAVVLVLGLACVGAASVTARDLDMQERTGLDNSFGPHGKDIKLKRYDRTMNFVEFGDWLEEQNKQNEDASLLKKTSEPEDDDVIEDSSEEEYSEEYPTEEASGEGSEDDPQYRTETELQERLLSAYKVMVSTMGSSVYGALQARFNRPVLEFTEIPAPWS